MYISNYIQTTFFYLQRLLEKLALVNDSSITEGSIYHINHYVHNYHESGLTWRLMEVSVTFDFNTYCFLIYTAEVTMRKNPVFVIKSVLYIQADTVHVFSLGDIVLRRILLSNIQRQHLVCQSSNCLSKFYWRKNPNWRKIQLTLNFRCVTHILLRRSPMILWFALLLTSDDLCRSKWWY